MTFSVDYILNVAVFKIMSIRDVQKFTSSSRFFLRASKRKEHSDANTNSEPPVIEGQSKDDGEYDGDWDG